MIEQLREFLLTCPLFQPYRGQDGALISVDSVGSKGVQYAIEIEPAPEWARRYVDGSGTKQLVFAMVSQNLQDARKRNAENLEFFRELSDWMRRTSLPHDDWQDLEPLTGGYMIDMDEGGQYARYRMQCRLLYAADAQNRR